MSGLGLGQPAFAAKHCQTGPFACGGAPNEHVHVPSAYEQTTPFSLLQFWSTGTDAYVAGHWPTGHPVLPWVVQPVFVHWKT
jgi:hypothetical protein